MSGPGFSISGFRVHSLRAPGYTGVAVLGSEG